ncbi:hypothetical protein Ait01nite_072380 [Actinoplanes italicus]|uniref:Uncharacterized protein n=1 Tax=Actinoplanes italicus TaxID=113567 RepID=A0A2T0KB95_9ACTN|nr:hypothetical protein [Actinoplanes italicus]PRX20276.1 hypothetical protein CLV67_10870 [Actinoplanes italicus]GIE34193.1 hypothetical protein Ait01nite_072380 [Actinoplanes italicus]
MTEQAEQHLIPAQSGPPAPGPWDDYLAAARELDAVRRVASSVAGEHATTVAAARQELTSVRARLAPQRARLARDFRVPENELIPHPAEQAAAMDRVAGGPPAVLAALREARATADAADNAFIGPAPVGPERPWARNMLVYGPFAGAVLLVQVLLFLVAPPDSPSTYALLCGLSMPLLAFGLGWTTIGFVYGGEGVKVDRTPVLGLITCLTPVLLTCAGTGLQALL